MMLKHLSVTNTFGADMQRSQDRKGYLKTNDTPFLTSQRKPEFRHLLVSRIFIHFPMPGSRDTRISIQENKIH